MLSQAERKVTQGQAGLWDQVSDAAAATLHTNRLVLQRAKRLGIVLTAERFREAEKVLPDPREKTERAPVWHSLCLP